MRALPRRICSSFYLFLGILTVIFPLRAGSQAAAQSILPENAQEMLPPVRVVHPIDDSVRVSLPGNVRAEAIDANDLGMVDDRLPLEHMQLLLARTPAQETSLDSYLAMLGDQRSPAFHRWLSPDEFGARFGVAVPDIDAVRQWLESHSLAVNSIYPNRMIIDFSGTAAQVRSAFRVEMHAYGVNGKRHFANNRNPSIPAALAPVVAGVVSLHDFVPRSQLATHPAYTTGSGSSETWPVTPADLAVIYNLLPAFKSGYTGKGQTIALVEDSNIFSSSDWTSFRSAFGLAGYSTGSLTEDHPAPLRGANNCANPGTIPGFDVEPIVDAEYASAAAPGAAIKVASCANTATFGGLIALENLLNSSSAPPAIVSVSFGECEALNGAAANAAYKTIYQQAAAEGVSVFVAAGDSGGALCDAGTPVALHGFGVNALASTAYNVAVGATDFSDTFSGTNSIYWNPGNSTADGSAKSYVPEIPWNDSCASVLLTDYERVTEPYGTHGFCNTAAGERFLTITAGGGGPSGCATGASAVAGVAGGGCKGWPKPSWQVLTGNPKDGLRDVPDVSLFGGDGLWRHAYLFCNSDVFDVYTMQASSCTGPVRNWAQSGGTSFAAPVMAGIQALVNQKHGRQGNPAPVYYRIAADEYTSSSVKGTLGNQGCNAALGFAVGEGCAFHDITSGNSDVACVGSYGCYLPSGMYGILSINGAVADPAFNTAPGWDFATGIGSVNAYNLLTSEAWEDPEYHGAPISGSAPNP
jgi:subtilase family serine protease